MRPVDVPPLAADPHPKGGQCLTKETFARTVERTSGGTVMSKIPDIVPVSDFRQDAAAVLKRLRSSGGPLVVTQRGRAVAVMQSVEVFNKQLAALELLRSLARGEREIAGGEGHTLDEVMGDAAALLATE